MGGSVGQVVDKVTKEVSGYTKDRTGIDLGSTNIKAQAEDIAEDTGIQHVADQYMNVADTVTKPFTEPVKKLGASIAEGLGLPTSLDQLVKQPSQVLGTSKANQKEMQKRVGLSELGQNMRQKQQNKFGRSQTSRTLITGKY